MNETTKNYITNKEFFKQEYLKSTNMSAKGEMAINQQLEYSKYVDIIEGYEDLGDR